MWISLGIRKENLHDRDSGGEVKTGNRAIGGSLENTYEGAFQRLDHLLYGVFFRS